MKRLSPLLFWIVLSAGRPPEEFMAVPEWWGSVIITHELDASEAGVRNKLPWVRTRVVKARMSFDFHLGKASPGGFIPGPVPPSVDDFKEAAKSRRTWRYVPEPGGLQIPANLVLDDRSAEESDAPVEGKVVDRMGESHTQSARGTAKLLLVLPMLIVDAKKGVYHLLLSNLPRDLGGLSAPDRYVQWDRTWREEYSEVVQTSNRDAAGLSSDLSRAKVASWGLYQDQPLPSSAARFEGSMTYDIPIAPFKEAKGRVTVRWLLTPKPPEPVELILEPQSGYPEWRPKGGLDEGIAGAHLIVKVRLQKKGGGEPTERARSIACRLLNVSREPGTCLNWPEKPQTPTPPDLRFEPSMNTGARNDFLVERTDGALKSMTVVVSSYDWGAFGELQATAVLDSGREVVSEVQGEPGRSTLRIPKCAEESRVADGWKSKVKTTEADDSDADAEPVGDGTPGDGFTVYEEYRGFVQEGHHLDTDPKTKDFFILDAIGGRSKSGIRMFAAASKLNVHHHLKAKETGRGGILNVNTSGYGHKANQHFVLLASHEETGYCIAVGGPGTPKDIQRVLMSPHPSFSLPADASEAVRERKTGEWERSLAHELFHCCNVYHHGESDTSGSWERAQDKDGIWKFWPVSVDEKTKNTTRLGGPVKLFTEPNTPVVPSSTPDLLEFWIGEKMGEHSGFESCLMRYECANAYRKGPGEFFVMKPELPGEGLCAGTEGAGYNNVPRVAGANFPMSRHGPADTSRYRGNCLLQICVNDGVPRKKRP